MIKIFLNPKLEYFKLLKFILVYFFNDSFLTTHHKSLILYQNFILVHYVITYETVKQNLKRL